MAAQTPLKQVLLVDDEQQILDLMQFSLRDLPLELHGVTDGRQALDWLRDRVPDLVVLDLMMPKLGGAEVYRRMQADERLRDVPVLVVSVVYPDETIIRNSALSRLPALPKPFSPTVFADRVRELIGI